ncbi:active breakpoint cluster region-related protein [Ixodes scapularis]|uniref:active breakpoint cluster region-related protein n=1 Tax=Ixodes scapularis TaxID=6945 RepID=UPI001C38A90B|nr:active breakpoint cluster region-related protein [Ixodes scapularis]
MEAFNDLQRNWAKRFPHSKLSLIWEEDVRTLLSTHRQRVAQLREELEQEEFLVQYFERYLSDAKRSTSRDKANNNSHNFADTNAGLENGDSASRNRNSNGVDGTCSNGLSDACATSSPGDKPPDSNYGKVRSAQSELAASQNKAAPQPPTNGDTDEHGKPYVTVIAVSGFTRSAASNAESVSSTPKTDSASFEGLDAHELLLQARRRRKPPTPPPKRAKWPPPAQVNQLAQKEPSSPTSEPVAAPAVQNQPSPGTCEPNSTKNSATEPQPAFSTFKPPAGAGGALPNFPPSYQESVGTREGLGETPATNDAADDQDGCDVIYDTVAFDDEGSSSKGADDEDHDVGISPEPDYVEFGKFERRGSSGPFLDEDRRPPLVSGSATTTSSSSATYENITLLKASESMDSEEDDGASILRSMSSDTELDHDAGTATTGSDHSGAGSGGRADRGKAEELLDVDSGVYSSSVESASFLSTSTPPARKRGLKDSEQNDSPPGSSPSESEMLAMCKCIVSSIIESETAYVDCLDTLNQYARALSSAIGTNQSVLSKEEIETIFYKIEQLHDTHKNFRDGLRRNFDNWDAKPTIGENFKFLASRLEVYKLFLENYSKAIETVRRCNASNLKFEELFKNIKLNTSKGQPATLEDLLHKPVARVQKNALVLHDLLHYIPSSHHDYNNLRAALKLTQRFLNELKLNSTESMFPHQDRAPRHVVKNSFIVEYSEGHRKLRHLFLFNDVIVCAKYKPSSRQKFTFEVKWYIPLSLVTLIDAEGEADPIREDNKVNVCQLRSRASTLRDLVTKEERENAKLSKPPGRNLERNRKKLSELEAQLVLHSPNLAFKIGLKNTKTYAFFLSSEFERSQWIEAINVLQSSAPLTVTTPSILELQSCITSARGCMGTNMGSFLTRTAKDEDLLVGDLLITVHNLQGLNRPADIFICFEVDSYGHFFKKARTKTCQNTLEPNFNQEVVIDLDGSQTLRILCYEEHTSNGTTATVLRGKAAFEMSRSWLTDKYQEKSFSLQECTLNLSIKYSSSDVGLQRVPSCKPVGSFGMKVQQVCKKEKSAVPFVITTCVREVERRGINEVGIYRVSGSASDLQRLKRTFENDPYEAEQLLKEVDINNVTGLLKLYLRELPEALFTDGLYPRFFEAFSKHDQEEKKTMLLNLFNKLPEVNQHVTLFLIDHMVKINQNEAQNKMSLHNLATVFGPSIIRPCSNAASQSPSDLLTTSTVDVMAQAGILYFFLRRRAAGFALSNSEAREIVQATD